MKLLREPLFHFTIAGVVLFAAYAWLNGSRPASDGVDPVRIGTGQIQWLKETYSSQWLRPPDANELHGLVTDLVNEELLAREAQAMGLGENDTIIRRRLAQKLKFLVDDTSRLAEPTDAVLRRYFEANAARFQESPRVSFSQIYFNPENRKDAARDADLVLAGLSTDAGANGAELGDRFLLEAEMTLADRQTIVSTFGDEFADALLAIEPGKWSGPLKSGYGTHLVFVSARETIQKPSFEAVRDKVVAEWRRENEQKASQDYVARLREKYGVEFDDSVKAQLEPQPAADVSMR
ncbi:peptidyl-prolyl cis-trans isomerase [Sinorhizobium meliloti]|uniref:peptidylprolyl isomerase n=1 Tax=Rhizobium meliloti TaxID=382 RepID=UPI000FDAF84D|nr:peptidyl-prolyl cis-trans isomerase [Sinorhizobium meliloti]RVL61052.1 peptidyl-prolyl cis-trans isomerase [Sinorhizobium meliloti]